MILRLQSVRPFRSDPFGLEKDPSGNDESGVLAIIVFALEATESGDHGRAINIDGVICETKKLVDVNRSKLLL